MLCIKQILSYIKKIKMFWIRKTEIWNPSKHWTIKSKSSVCIVAETISWRIQGKKKDSFVVFMHSFSQLTCRVHRHYQIPIYKHTCRISVLFVILHTIIKNFNENKILKCHTNWMHTTGTFVCLVLSFHIHWEITTPCWTIQSKEYSSSINTV